MSQKTGTLGGNEDEDWYIDASKPILKFAVAAGVLVTLWWVVLNVEATAEVTMAVPGAEEAVTAGEIISAVLTVFLLAAVLKFSADVGSILTETTGLGLLSSLSKLVGIVIALAFAHQMFGWVTNIFPVYASYYDLAFLVVGLLVGGLIGVVLYSNVDEVVEALG